MSDTPSDEEIVAHLDGETDPADTRAMAARMARDPALRARVEALDIDTGAIRAAFDALADHAPPPPDLPASLFAEPPDRTMRNAVGGALAGAVLASAILLAGVALVPDRGDGWRDSMAGYQALYVARTLSHLAPDPADQAAELADVAGAIGKDIALGDLTALPGLAYKRAQILGFEGRPLGQFAFLSAVGAPLALCIIRAGDGEADAPLTTGTMAGMSVANWTRGGHAYMLIGGTDDALVGAAARAVMERI